MLSHRTDQNASGFMQPAQKRQKVAGVTPDMVQRLEAENEWLSSGRGSSSFFFGVNSSRKGKGKGGNKKKGGKGNRARNNQKKGKSGKKNGKKGDKKNKDSDSNKKKGRSGKDSKLLPEFLYNQLWCFDLAMEQVLKSFDNNLVFMPMSGNTSLMYFLCICNRAPARNLS